MMQQRNVDQEWHFSEGGKVDTTGVFLNIRDPLPDCIDVKVDVGILKDFVRVVRCKDCSHCRLLNDGVSFECSAWDTEFYAPTYDAATYYCADGERRDGDVQS